MNNIISKMLNYLLLFHQQSIIIPSERGKAKSPSTYTKSRINHRPLEKRAIEGYGEQLQLPQEKRTGSGSRNRA